MTTRLQWDDIAPDIRDIIGAQTGPVLKAEPVSDGHNSELAVIVHTEQARTFVKGLRMDHPRSGPSTGNRRSTRTSRALRLACTGRSRPEAGTFWDSR
ncbi:MAG: hypothetical protein ACR2GH_14940 [Pseudonocardia sp.]